MDTSKRLLFFDACWFVWWYSIYKVYIYVMDEQRNILRYNVTKHTQS